MRALLFEPNFSGHHLYWSGLLLPALSELVESVIFATTEEARQSSEYDAYIRPLENVCRVIIVPSPSSGSLQNARPLHRALAKWKALKSVVRDSSPDYVYVPTGDGLLQAAAFLPGSKFFRKIPSEILLLSCSFAYPQQGMVRKFRSRVTLSTLKKSPFSKIHMIDPLGYDFIQQNCSALLSKIDLFPDPAENISQTTKIDARQKLGLPQEGRIIGCTGVLDKRKGVDLLLDAFSRAPLGDNDRLLLAGIQKPEIKKAVQKARSKVGSSRLLQIERFISSEEFHLALSAMDVVAVPYPKHIGSSGLLIRAAAANRPVLASEFGWVGYVTKLFGLGNTCQVTNPLKFSNAIQSSLSSCNKWDLSQAGKRFLAFHSVENFVANWTHGLRLKLGLNTNKNNDKLTESWNRVIEAAKESGVAQR